MLGHNFPITNERRDRIEVPMSSANVGSSVPGTCANNSAPTAQQLAAPTEA